MSAPLPAQLTGYSERSPSLSKTPACSSPVTAIPPIRRSLCTPDNMVEIPYYAAFHNAFTRRRDMMFSFMQHASILQEEPSQSPSPAGGHEDFGGFPRGSHPQGGHHEGTEVTASHARTPGNWKPSMSSLLWGWLGFFCCFFFFLPLFSLSAQRGGSPVSVTTCSSG